MPFPRYPSSAGSGSTSTVDCRVPTTPVRCSTSFDNYQTRTSSSSYDASPSYRRTSVSFNFDSPSKTAAEVQASRRRSRTFSHDVVPDLSTHKRSRALSLSPKPRAPPPLFIPPSPASGRSKSRQSESTRTPSSSSGTLGSISAFFGGGKKEKKALALTAVKEGGGGEEEGRRNASYGGGANQADSLRELPTILFSSSSSSKRSRQLSSAKRRPSTAPSSPQTPPLPLTFGSLSIPLSTSTSSSPSAHFSSRQTRTSSRPTGPRSASQSRAFSPPPSLHLLRNIPSTNSLCTNDSPYSRADLDRPLLTTTPRHHSSRNTPSPHPSLPLPLTASHLHHHRHPLIRSANSPVVMSFSTALNMLDSSSEDEEDDHTTLAPHLTLIFLPPDSSPNPKSKPNFNPPSAPSHRSSSPTAPYPLPSPPPSPVDTSGWTPDEKLERWFLTGEVEDGLDFGFRWKRTLAAERSRRDGKRMGGIDWARGNCCPDPLESDVGPVYLFPRGLAA